MTQPYKIDKLTAKDIDIYLEKHQKKLLLRFITCGSVDDGKSTLIGRFLYDSNLIFEDQLVQLKIDSKKIGTQGKKIDFALLVDGLAAEREQGITIDVSYRFFSTKKRKFIVADTPGHEQYTRNMVTGASTAELAVILIDARKGVLTQTRRHSYLCHLLGIKKFVLAINKMDLIGYDKDVFNTIINNYREFADRIGIKNFTPIPISALKGDNIILHSNKTSWYNGLTLINHLESVELDETNEGVKGFCMPVQWVNRPNLDFRGFSGKIAAGSIKRGDQVRIIPSNKNSYVDRIVTFEGDLDMASVGQSVTVTLKDEIDCSRGQVMTSSESPLEIADQFNTTIFWMDEKNLIPGRDYYVKIAKQTVTAIIAKPKYEINVNTLEHVATKSLKVNSIGVAIMTIDRSIPFTPYDENKTLGGFILIDKFTNATVGAGLINFALQRSQNIYLQPTYITRDHHANIKNQKPAIIWMTGLSGSGKSIIANTIEKKLHSMNRHTFLLDGDNIRHGLNKDLGFTEADRIENIRRVGEVAKLMADAGLIVITAFISPFESERQMVRKMMKPGEFIEVFINTPLDVAEKRDVKGLYAKARLGQLKNFTGIDSPYETPQNPDLIIDTISNSIDEAAEKIIKKLFSQ
jgi:bifunctional enzyme CysN/CysC